MTSTTVTVTVDGVNKAVSIQKVKMRVVREFHSQSHNYDPVKVIDNTAYFIANALFGDATEEHVNAVLDSLDYDQMQTVFHDCLEFNGLEKPKAGEEEAAEKK